MTKGRAYALMEGNLFHVLHRCGHQRLFHHVTQSPQTAIAKPMELFSIREASLNGEEGAGFTNRWIRLVMAIPVAIGCAYSHFLLFHHILLWF
ncbi:hypothetical protein J2X83_003429 [Brevibacillus nitrificans]|nr:hypothetical protein [Brevibacillus nitrificans]